MDPERITKDENGLGRNELASKSREHAKKIMPIYIPQPIASNSFICSGAGRYLRRVMGGASSISSLFVGGLLLLVYPLVKLELPVVSQTGGQNLDYHFGFHFHNPLEKLTSPS